VKILVVEDETALLESVIKYLSAEGHICEKALTFSTALDKIETYSYDCYIIDINLPGGTGYDLITNLKRKNNNAGIIIISALNTTDDRIKGLNIGADDYLTKPFNLAELNARLKSLFRRINFQGNNCFLVGDICIFPNEFRIEINNKSVDLTRKEYELLLFLASNQNRVITKEILAEHLWGDYIDAADSFDFVYTHIKNLRKKLQVYNVSKYIQNIYGVGYKFSTIETIN